MHTNEQTIIVVVTLLSGTVLFPVITGLYRYRQLDFSFRLLLCIHVLALIHDSLFDFISDAGNKHLFEKQFTLLDLSLTYGVLLIWRQKKQPFKKVLIFFLAMAITFIVEDVFFYEKGQLRYSLADPLFYLFITFIEIEVFVFLLKNTKEKKEKIIKAGISFLSIISTTQYILFNFFTYYFYNKETYILFSALFCINMSFVAFTNLFTALSFIWIPKKQQYL